MKNFVCVTALGLVVATGACSAASDTSANATSDLRSINADEAVAELDAVGDAIGAYYGPLEFKEQRFGFDLDAELAAATAKIRAGTTEGDRVRPVMELLAKLHDSHVSYEYYLPGDATTVHRLPFFIAPYEGQFLVEVAAPNLGLDRGDVVESIDGLTPAQIDQIIAPMIGEGNPATEAIMRALYMTYRPFYEANALIPTNPLAHVIVTKADGTQATLDLPWEVAHGGLDTDMGIGTATGGASSSSKTMPIKPGSMIAPRASFLHDAKNQIRAGYENFDSLTPFWMSSQASAALGLAATTPKPETLAALNTTVKTLDLSAYKYTYEGKKILVVRLPDFMPYNPNDPNEDVVGENIGWLAALLKDNLDGSADNADVVVLDETDNPGGDVQYALGVASLFATKPIPSLVEAVHGDRHWLESYGSELAYVQTQPAFASFAPVLQGRIDSIESAYDNSKLLSDFIPLTGDPVGPNVAWTDPTTVLGGNMLPPNPNVQWGKPVLVLHDALSVSCADFFPAILQNAGVAKTFGERTMGGGGNVEPVLQQAHSGASLSLTRGMGGPYNPNGAPKLIENEGVTPDFAHPVTVADFRAGFVDYATSFSHVAATLTR